MGLQNKKICDIIYSLIAIRPEGRVKANKKYMMGVFYNGT